MISNAMRRLRAILFLPASDGTELLLACMTLVFGVQVLNPTFRAFLPGVLPEWVWGAVGIVLGGISIALLVVGAQQPRRIASFLQSVFWLFVALRTTLGSPSPGLLVYWVIAAFSGWFYLRHLEDK